MVNPLQRQERIEQLCPDFIKKDKWPPNSPDLSPLDCHVWGAMLEKYKTYMLKPTNKAELKTVQEAIREDFPQDTLDQTVLAFKKKLLPCIQEEGHFEHLVQ